MAAQLRTIASLVDEARAATSAADAGRSLGAAAAQASTFREWEAILGALPDLPSVPPEAARTLIARAKASAEARHEVWGYRTVALAEVRTLADESAARATLTEAETMLSVASDGDVLGFEWGALADGFVEALKDHVSARRCLEAGWQLAYGQRDVENLGRLVGTWAKLVGRTEALAKLAAVEASAAERGDLGGVIYWWHALGDAEAGRRVRQTLVESTRVFSEALDLIHFWNLYEKDSPGIDVAFARAEALASGANEWFDLARTACFEKNGADEALARRALDRARDAADTTELRARVASAYLAWFDDAATAEKVGPAGVAPETLRPRLTTLTGWNGSASALLDALRQRIAPSSLEEIAAADYGMDADKHRAALDAICASGLVPLELAWHPGEVVELTRWSSGEGVDHVARAFCCTLLFLSSPESEMTTNGPMLVESCLALGADVAERAEELLVWHFETQETDAPEAWVTLFTLFLLRAGHAPHDPRLPALLTAMRERAGDGLRSLRQWMAESQRAELWGKLLAEIVPVACTLQDEVARLIEAIGVARVVPGEPAS